MVYVSKRRSGGWGDYSLGAYECAAVVAVVGEFLEGDSFFGGCVNECYAVGGGVDGVDHGYVANSASAGSG